MGSHPNIVINFKRQYKLNLKLDYVDLDLVHYAVALNWQNDGDLCPQNKSSVIKAV